MSVQSEDALKEVGKTAALVEDGSPLALGMTGTIDGKTFKILGRIQYNFGLGYWNEWFLGIADDAGGPAWLGEANGIYFFTRQMTKSPLREDLPFESLEAGMPLYIDDNKFFVKDIQKGKVVSGEGELPFSFTGEYEAPVVDCVNAKGEFATIDFSEEKPIVFLGKVLRFTDLHLNRVRSVYGFKAEDAGIQGLTA